MPLEAFSGVLNEFSLCVQGYGCQLNNNRPYCAKHDSLDVMVTMTTRVGDSALGGE